MDDYMIEPEEMTRLLGEFRKSLTAAGEDEKRYDDPTLMRFLVARECKVDKAQVQLLAWRKWSDELKLDEMPLPGSAGYSVLYPVRGFDAIPDQNPDPSKKGWTPEFAEMVKYMGGSSFHKCDKAGRPIYIERVGLYDTKNWANTKHEVWSDFHIKSNEMLYRTLMTEASKKTGKVIDKNTVIFDLDGMGWHQFYMGALNLLKVVVDMDQAYYPERLGMLFVVNAPSIFTKVWAIVKKWLDKRMLGKIHILGSNFREVLLEHIDAKNLPDFLGGECTCGHIEGGCCPSPFAKDARARKSEYPYLVECSSKEGHTFEMYVPEEVKERAQAQSADVNLRWKFKSQKAVTFEVRHVAEDSKEEKTLIPAAKQDSHVKEISAHLPVMMAGTYKLIWKTVHEGSSGLLGWATGSSITMCEVEYAVELDTGNINLSNVDTVVSEIEGMSVTDKKE